MAPLEKQTEITTEIALEIAGLWFAGKLAQANEFTLKRVVVQETAQELSAQGTISREIAQTVQNFAKESPVEAAKLIQEGQTSQRFKAFTEVREIFVAQGASQETAQLDLAGIQAAKVLDSPMWPVKGGAEAKKSFLNSFKEAGERSVGARGRLKYEPVLYHGRVGNHLKSKGPTDGQQALGNSVRVSENAPRRVGIDYETGEL